MEATPIEAKPIEETVVEGKVGDAEKPIIRTNELIKCPKCNKLVTQKTLLYSQQKRVRVKKELMNRQLKQKQNMKNPRYRTKNN